jgi:hypothetical protein
VPTPTYEISARSDVAQRAEMIDVAISYCTGTVFVHNHQRIEPAVKEYSERLAEAVEPSARPPHVRQVSLLFYNENGESISFVDSGTFGCNHSA